uniref:non-specific serine/threonine protein kinase n=1 Tax=Leersia perrieri TaxID=77586 RepID=A0A0D9XCI7_9ORYZ
MAPLHRRLLLILAVVAVSGVLHAGAAFVGTPAGGDAGALLAVKASLSDPAGALDAWRVRTTGNLCRWPHVDCAGNSTAVAVEGLNLGDLALAGGFPVAVCSLSSLRHLDMSSNDLAGPLPACLAALPALETLNLASNNFSGEVPAAYGSGFPSLAVLNLIQNLLTGAFPGFLANVSSLQELLLAYNSFSPSPLPDNIGDLAALRVLFLANCSLTGNIPLSIGKLQNLVNLDLSSNNLTGEIPRNIGNLSSLVQIELFSNQLSGEIPSGIGRLKKLQQLDISMNQISGEIPEDMFAAPSLESVHMFQNNLTGWLPAMAGAAERLTELMIFANQIEGALPPDLGMNCPLESLDVSDNRIFGPIPATLCAGGKLKQLLLLNNMFDGEIPAELGGCRSLTRVRLPFNRLSGEVPPEFWGLPHVYLLELRGNALSGNVDAAIGRATNLSSLIIDNNRFTGVLPTELGNLTNLAVLLVANNSFSGTVPPSLSSLSQLLALDLSNNSLSGEIPRSLGQLKNLTMLDLSDNHLNGSIPVELGGIHDMNVLDLSHNELSGGVPAELQSLKFGVLNLSYNKLTGHIPSLFRAEQFRESFLGNPGLCYRICSKYDDVYSHRARVQMIVSILVVTAVILLLTVAWYTYKYKMYHKRAAEIDSQNSEWVITSFHKVEFSERDIVNSMTENNLVGKGGSGMVYKAVVRPNGDALAVKKLLAGSMSSKKNDTFEAEVQTLSKVRHRNIVKLFCCLTREASRVLVYEFMPNGSLGDFLHSAKAGILDWPTRYKILVDAAEGLSYLHHDCVPAIIHRDVKSNNILLDADFRAKVADFGVAKCVGDGPATMSIIAGSCGYIAPEYAYTVRITEKSDIYSFGVVMLELVTGKSPMSSDLGGKGLGSWVATNVEKNGVESVLDLKIAGQFKDEMCGVLKIALLCVKHVPNNRPSMRFVVRFLLDIKGEIKPKTLKVAEAAPAIRFGGKE